ncbi:MAG: 50S ribosomal protein L6 [Tenericutes bacterium]|nr:50S ribosomal protein L6 [Mycoplasmatota bacterium]
MSRIGNRILTIPDGVEVKIEGNKVITTGPKGTLEFLFKKDNVDVKVEDGKISVTRKNELKVSKQLHGTTNSVISNMLIGVSEGYSRELETNGVGYKFQLQGNKVVIHAGYSHTVELDIPAGIKVTMPEKSVTELTISGFDKQAVSEFAANIRKVRKPEPYKGKGIKFKEERIRRKEGKKAA